MVQDAQVGRVRGIGTVPLGVAVGTYACAMHMRVLLDDLVRHAVLTAQGGLGLMRARERFDLVIHLRDRTTSSFQLCIVVIGPAKIGLDFTTVWRINLPWRIADISFGTIALGTRQTVQVF